MKGLLMAAMLAALPVRADETAKPAEAKASEAAVSVTKSAVCTAVNDREPVGAKDAPAEFEAAVEKLYFWNAADVKAPPQTITHVWSKDGKAATKISLELKHARTRTWSSKKVSAGKWKVEAVAADGTVLQTAEFTVK